MNPPPPRPATPHASLDLVLRAPGLSTTQAELQLVHVPPSGVIGFPNRSAFEVTHRPGAPEVLSASRSVHIDLSGLRARYGDQPGHLYAVTVHSQPRTLEFRGMTLDVRGPDFEERARPLDLVDHAALLGVWWQDRAGHWAFEHSGQILDTLNATYQSIFLAGRHAERFAER